MDPELQEKQLSRLHLANIALSPKQKQEYLESPDDLGVAQEGQEIPLGYKRCGKCKHILKLYLYNINNASKNKCTGNCKACQKATAAISYEKNKHKRNYKQYYEEHKEIKLAHSRNYYQKNKEVLLNKHAEYRKSKAGQKVMKRAHKKRQVLLTQNRGINYKREWVIDRDKLGQEYPICYLCGEPITAERGLQLDHVIPVALGGKDCFTNIACTHELCNLRKPKDARTMSVEQVETVLKRAEEYIDAHPELFDEE